MTTLFSWRRLLVCLLHASFYILILSASVATGRYFEDLGYTNAVGDQWFLSRAALGVFIVAAFPLAIRDRGYPSEFFLHILMLLIVTPTMVLFAASASDWFFVATTLVSCAVVALLSRIPFKVKTIPFIKANAAIWIFLGIVIAYFLALLAFGQGKFVNVDPMRVYEFRREAAANLPTVFNYFLPWTAKVVITAGLALALYLKTRLLFAMFCLAAVGVFAFSSHKEPLLYPFITVAVFYLAARRETLLPFLSIAAAGALLIVVDAHYLSLQSPTGFSGNYLDGGWIADYILRRAVLVPSALNEHYLDFFGGEGVPYWWSSSRITLGLVPSPYDVTAPFKIGEIYFGRPTMSANAGWIGAGYANGLLLGTILYSCVLGCMLSIVDSVAMKNSKPLVAAIIAVPLLSLIISADLFTALLTHGLLLAFGITFVLRAPPLSVSGREETHSMRE